MKRLYIITIIVVITVMLILLWQSYQLGYEIGKHSIITNPNQTVTDLQKELTDFADKRRELYKKTHHGD